MNQEMKINSPESVGTAKSKLLQLWWLVIKPSSPTSRISIFQSGWRRKKMRLRFRGSEKILGRHRCCCCCYCCEWSLGKMKPIAAYKFPVSLLGVEQKDECYSFVFLYSEETGWRRTPNRWLWDCYRHRPTLDSRRFHAKTKQKR